MNTSSAIGVFTLVALFAGTAFAADDVAIFDDGGGVTLFSAGKHDYSETIVSTYVPENKGVVVYD